MVAQTQDRRRSPAARRLPGRRLFGTFVGSSGTVVILGWLLATLGVVPPPVLPFLLLVIGAVVAIVFRHGRILQGLGWMALASGTVAGPGLASSRALVLLALVNLVGLGWSRSHGPWSRRAAAGWLAFALQIAVSSRFEAELSSSLAGLASVATLERGVLAVLLLGLLLRVARRLEPVDRGLWWAAGSVALAGPGPLASGQGGTTLLVAGVAALGAASLEASHALAFRDALTRLPSRRALEADLAELTPPYAIAMVDVDRFKRLNDQYGHAIGDQVLAMVARRLGEVTGGGTAYRYGGEEFALLFPGRDRADAAVRADAVRSALASQPFRERGGGREIKVTVSVGVADAPHDAEAPQGVLKAADKALYRAKQEGRNRVVTSGVRRRRRSPAKGAGSPGRRRHR